MTTKSIPKESDLAVVVTPGALPDTVREITFNAAGFHPVTLSFGEDVSAAWASAVSGRLASFAPFWRPVIDDEQPERSEIAEPYPPLG